MGDRVLSFTVFGGSIALLLLSLSRSYWLALLLLGAIAIAWTVRRWYQSHYSPIRANRRIVRGMLGITSSVVCMIILATVVVRLPYPKPLTTARVGETLLARFSADAAVSNRWQQIGPLRDAILLHPVLGNGFGAAVTYETRDPRTLAAYPDGKYTTTAFEWGYLDDLLERGLIGLLAELLLLGTLIWYGLRPQFSPPLTEGEREGARHGVHRVEADASALALGLLAISVVHATSPYLNHPLGIGVITLLFGWIVALPAREKPSPFVTSNGR